MLIGAYKKLLILLLVTLVYSNLFLLSEDIVFVSIYPYISGLTGLFVIFYLVLHLFKNTFIVKTIYVLMSLITVFFIFTFFQVWKNIKISSKHEARRNSYIKQLADNIKTRRNVNTDISLGPTQEQIRDLMKVNTGTDIAFYNEALLIYDDTEIFDEIIKEISGAKKHIHVEFFIIRNDKIGKKFKDILIEKAREGVEVRVIYDGLGSIGLKRNYSKELQKEGVQIKAYDAIWKSIAKGKLNHRNHRKIIIVDGKTGFTGGVNIGDEYLSRDNKIGNWKDILVKIKGEAVADMQKVFLGDWHYVSGEKLLDNKYFPKWEGENILPIQIVDGMYDTHWNEISQTYFSIITAAKERIYIATPYLVLSNGMVEALQVAALSGVDVRLILPKNPDLFLVRWVNSSFFKQLLNSKVKIYLYEDGFIHSKVFVADNKVVSIGSANLNTRSQYLDYEMNALIFDDRQADRMVNELLKNMNDSRHLKKEDYSRTSLIRRFKEIIGKLARPLI